MPQHVVVAEHPGGGGAHDVVGGQRVLDHLALVDRAPRGLEVPEVERLLELVGPHVERAALGRLDPGLGHHHPVARVGVEDLAPLLVHRVHAVLVPHRGTAAAGVGVVVEDLVLAGPVRQALLLDQAVRDVDPEAVDAAVEPEPQDVVEGLVHLRVRPVEVGLLDVEQVQVPLAGGAVRLGDPGPRGAAEDRAPVGGRLVAVRALAVAEHVHVALGAARPGREGGPEPGVLVAGVVGHQVDHDLDAGLVRRGDEACRRPRGCRRPGRCRCSPRRRSPRRPAARCRRARPRSRRPRGRAGTGSGW